VIDKSPDRIAAMFDGIAARYDLLNHLLTAGADRRWRRRAIASLELRGGESVLDVCAGTGDLAIAALGWRPAPGRVIALDMAGSMLLRAARKAEAGGPPPSASGSNARVLPLMLLRGDATMLPLPDGCADVVTNAFGVRNVAALERALCEFRRVLRPGGRLSILEFGLPAGPILATACRAYLHTVVPLLGWLVSGDFRAYRYLARSVDAFPSGGAFADLMRKAGFEDVEFDNLAPGIVYLYGARKPS
jgi:demethylmenaquinone methyltransferase/2-methoxy-6-polyprenyl-1,4-benzoquinol methylase